MMLDQHETRLWADYRHVFADWLAAIPQQVLDASAVAVRQLYAAPWEEGGPPRAVLGRVDVGPRRHGG